MQMKARYTTFDVVLTFSFVPSIIGQKSGQFALVDWTKCRCA